MNFSLVGRCPMSHERLFADLALWRELEWLRVLDEQFARQVQHPGRS